MGKDPAFELADGVSVLLGFPLGRACYTPAHSVVLSFAHECSLCSPLKYDHASLFHVIPVGVPLESSKLFYH